MAKTLTWGSGGVYSNLKAAWDDAVWDDDIIFEQVGTATDNTAMSEKARGGYTAIVRGNGDTWTKSTGTNLFEIPAANGSLILEDLTYSHTTATYATHAFYTTAGGSDNGYKLVVRRCNFTVKHSHLIRYDSGGFSDIEIYANDFTITSSYNDAFIAIFDTTPSFVYMYIEDNFFSRTTSGTLKILRIDFPTRTIFRRNYAYGSFSSNGIFHDASSATCVDGISQNFCSFVDSYINGYDTTHDEIAFTLDNFLSVTGRGTDPNYGIPKVGSPVYDDASQTTNIPDNLVGLNNVAVDYRAAGPYTPETQIQPPTGIAYTTEDTGIKVTWTPYSPAQAGYEDVGVYYDTIPDESAFTTLRATVLKGTNEYTIPYSELTSNPLWYVRLTHRPEA